MLVKPASKFVYNPSSIFHYFTFSTNIFPRSKSKRQQTSRFLVYCNSQITTNGRSGNMEEAESIFKRMPNKNTISWTAMLTAYAQNGKISKARELFDQMPERTTPAYNAMMTAYIKNHCNVDEVHGLFNMIPERNSISYAAMITGFVQANMLKEAERIYGDIPIHWRDPVCSNALINGYLKEGRLEEAVRVFDGMVERDVVSWSSIIDGYCKRMRIDDARVLFERMPERNVVTWTTMIDGYMKMGCFEDGFSLFMIMRKEGVVDINSTTSTIIFEGCGNFGRYMEGIQVHGLVLRMGFDFDVFLGNSILTMYCRFGCVGSANVLFGTMKKKDLVSWNALIAGHVRGNKIDEAYNLFLKMPVKDVVSWTTMLTGFSTVGEMDKFVHLFRTMPYKDDIAWTALVSGFVSNEMCEKAFYWYTKMLEEAVRPNALTLSSLLSASASLAVLDVGLQVHGQVVKMDLEIDLSVQNSLVSMYSKCGNVDEAYRIFTTIDKHNVVSYNSMISGFAKNGHGEKALELFKQMKNDGLEPNRVTFLGVLSACAHVGLVETGWEYFELMKSWYGIEPTVDHYACMVDLLGRAGLLDEAIDLICSMPIDPHVGVWGALLGASKTHLRPDLAELAAKKLMVLEPRSATPYVVLADLFSVLGRKEEDQVRNVKISKGIKKNPGCSWIRRLGSN